MEKIILKTTSGIVRASSYCTENGINKDLAIVYLTILLDNHKADEEYEPFPIWLYGLNDIEKYLKYFIRFNLIRVFKKRYFLTPFLKSDYVQHLVEDESTVNLLNNSALEIEELYNYTLAS